MESLPDHAKNTKVSRSAETVVLQVATQIFEWGPVTFIGIDLQKHMDLHGGNISMVKF